MSDTAEQNHLSNNEKSDLMKDESHYWLSRISDISGLGIILFNENLGLEFYNKSASKHFELASKISNHGASYDDILSHLINRGDFGSGDTETTIAKFKDILKAQISAPLSEKADINLTTPSGRRLKVSQKVDNNGKLLLVSKDISIETHKSDILDTALESGGSGFWYYNCETGERDLHGDYLEKHLSQRQMRRAREDGVFAVIHPDDIVKAKQVWDQGLLTGQEWKHTCRISTGNGSSLWLRWNAKPQLSESGKVISFTSFFKDITNELETNDALRKAKEEAEKALTIKNDFLARLSHEIRTPMNGVIGIADALIHHHADEAINPKLEIIQSSAEKILRIVDESLNHTKLHAEKLTLDSTPSSPAEAVKNVVQLWEHKALKNNITLSYNIDDTVPETIIFDHFRYEQCLNNLLSNAIKFTPNGTIQVILTTVESEGHPTRLVLAVKDSGIGMTAEQQKQVFEAYAQADKSIARRFGGTGLGMSITKEIIELMGGTITLRSESGKGSIFALSLPIDNVADHSAPVDSSDLVNQLLEDAKPEPTNYSNLRVLIVDDNATNHMVASSLIESIVGEIHIACDGEQAIEVLKTTPIDIVLMDIHMPVMDGIEATLAIRGSSESYSDVLIIALTADPQYQQIRLCKNIGMDDALAKPVRLTELLRAFDSVLSIETESEKLLQSA